MSSRILVVDDEKNIRRSLEIILEAADFDVDSVVSGEQALKKIQNRPPHMVFLDINLPGLDGLEVLRRLRSDYPQLPVVIISGHATIERAVEATRLGAFDFVEKPFSRERILVLARNACEAGSLREEVARLHSGDNKHQLLGDSPSILALRETIKQVAPTDSRVLILGESGTGKELVAAALHRQSPRAKKPFVRVNCAAIPEELIEAELFGAVKGAYTGATVSRDGKFAAADGGTILLDEIGDMSLRTQAKVLRVLQEGEIEPVGSNRTVKVDVRVLAATHQDLQLMVGEGLFREDLYFRLNVIPLQVPPLRKRPGDTTLLAGKFLKRFAEYHGLAEPQLSAASVKLLEAYEWPGNVRELKNVTERLVILRQGLEIGPDDLKLELQGQGGGAGTKTGIGEGEVSYFQMPVREARDALERDMIQAALARNNGNITNAAAELGLERTHLHKRLKALGLRSG